MERFKVYKNWVKTLTALAILAAITISCGSEDDIAKALDPGINDHRLNPTAVITGSRTVHVKSSLLLTGANSTDPKNEPLTYQWVLAERPFGSTATLGLDATAVAVTLFIDKGGFYTVTLVVTNSSGLASPVASARISSVGTGSNHPPVAIIASTVASGAATLDGTASYDVDGDSLTYHWEVVNSPNSGKTTIRFPNDPLAFLFSDSGLNLIVLLTVSDGVDSETAFANVSISATTTTVTPVTTTAGDTTAGDTTQ